MVELLHNKHCGGIIASFKSKINEKFGDNTINSSCSGGGISNEGFFGESYDKLLKSCDKIKADDLDGDKLKCKNLSSNKWEYTDNGKYKIGPFSFKFAGTVSKLVVKGIENYTIKDSSGNVIQEEDIKSEKKFYIYASKIQKKNITVKIKVKATTLHAELDIYRSCGEKTEQNILKGSGDKKDIKGEGEATVSIKPDDGKIKIFKTGDEGEPLANAIFAIYKPNGEELQRKWTNGEGIVEFKNLDINPVNKKTTYKVKEIKAPDGYSIRNVSSSPTVTMDEKEVEIEKTNSKGDDDDNTPPDTASEGDTITIFKCDKDTGKPLKGIKFNITIEDTTYETEATGDDGITTFKIDPETHLPAITSLSGETKNTYTATITEVAYNNGEDNDLFGYKPDNTSHTVTIEEIIEKYGEEGTYSDKDSQPSNVYSPKNSIVLYSDDTEDSYTKKHSGKSQGYKVTAKVKYDGEDEYVKCENEKQTGNLIIQKVDSENEGKQLDVEGIRFKITLNEEHWISRKYKSNVIFETTQSDGTITLNDIYVGQYTIEEITDPMSLNKEQGYAYTVTASPQIQAISRQPSDETEAGAEVYIDGNTLKYENEKQKGNLTIKKVDENGNGLAGVKFQIERYGGKYPKSPLSVVCDDDSDLDNGEYKVISEDDDEGIDTFVTNEQGEIKIIDLLQNDGNSAAVYRIREIKIPEDGMGIGDETDKYGYFGHIKSDNVNYGAYEKVSGTNDKYAEVTLSKNSTVTVVAINIKDTVKELNILKVDEDTDNVVLDGVGFKLYAELENKKSGWLRINDEDGPIKQLGYEATSIEIVSEDDATTFETTGGGKISITNVISGKYYAKEMYTHPQYELKQGLIELGELKKDQSYNITIENKRLRCDVEGYVWEEQMIGKDNIANSLHDEKDNMVDGVKVSLYSDDDGLPRGDPAKQPIDEVITNSEGRYAFHDLDYQNLGKYYIEFEYNGVLYTSVGLNIEPDEGSKAEEIAKIEAKDGRYGNTAESREALNQRFNTISNDNSYGNIYTDEKPTGNNSATNGQIKYNISSDGKTANVDYTSNINSVEKYNVNVNTGNVNNYYGAEKYRVISTTDKNFEFTKDDIIFKEKNREVGGPLQYVDRINQGIVKRDKPDMAIKLDLLNAKVDINGASDVFQYNQSGMTGNNINESADDDNGLILTFDETVYNKNIYTEDLQWINSEARNDQPQLEIYLTYGIKISNQSEGTNTGGLSMLLNKLDVYYDKEILDLNGWGTQLSSDSKQISDLKGLNVDNSSNIASGKRLDLRKSIGSNTDALYINANRGKYIYLQFRINNLKDFAQQNENVQNIKIVTEISSYTTYMQNQEAVREGQQTESNLYAGIDKDSAPGNSNGINSTLFRYEDDTRISPTLKLRKRDSVRKLEGFVFEDKPSNSLRTTDLQDSDGKDTKTANGQVREGNGKYDSGEESGIQGVAVVMIDVNNTNNRYETVTDGNGKYTIESFVPGQYIMQYIWGEKKYILDTEGKLKQVEQIDNYNIGNYKNTIYDLKKFGNDDAEYLEYDQSSRWYTDEDTYSHTKEGYSIATDLYSSKEELEREKKTTHYLAGECSSQENKFIDRDEIDTYLSKLDNSTSLSHFDDNVIISTSQQYLYLPVELDSQCVNATNGNWLVVSTGLTEQDENHNPIEKKYGINKLNFGIIERARQSVELIKKVSHVKITLPNNTDLINTDVNGMASIGQLSGQHSGVKYIRRITKSKDNGMIDMEIDKELLYGATLEITYTFTFKNNSELDYNDQGHNYHRYGTTYQYGKGKSEGYYKDSIAKAKLSGCIGDIITITPTTVIDYVDNELAVNELPNGYEKTNADTLFNNDTGLKVYSYKYGIDDESYKQFTDHVKKYNTILKIATDRKISDANKAFTSSAYNNEFKLDILPNDSATSQITLNRLLTNNSEETFTYNNDAEIVGLTKNGGNMVGVSQHEPDEVTIGNYRNQEDYRIGNYDPDPEYREETDEIDSDGEKDHTETVIIIPPTGEDRSYTYYIIGAVALIVLATGIIVIKKVVLK